MYLINFQNFIHIWIGGIHLTSINVTFCRKYIHTLYLSNLLAKIESLIICFVTDS